MYLTPVFLRNFFDEPQKSFDENIAHLDKCGKKSCLYILKGSFRNMI